MNFCPVSFCAVKDSCTDAKQCTGAHCALEQVGSIRNENAWALTALPNIQFSNIKDFRLTITHVTFDFKTWALTLTPTYKTVKWDLWSTTLHFSLTLKTSKFMFYQNSMTVGLILFEYELLSSEFQPDRHTAIHTSSLCLSTGGLNKKWKRLSFDSPPEYSHCPTWWPRPLIYDIDLRTHQNYYQGTSLHQILGSCLKQFSRESADRQDRQSHRPILYPRPLTQEGKITLPQTDCLCFHWGHWVMSHRNH